MIEPSRLRNAYRTVRDALLAERTAAGHWVGELSSSALSTATAAAALAVARREPELVDRGIAWLAAHQNPDGGWGDTTRSFSNISTTMLCRAAFHLCGKTREAAAALARCEAWLFERHGRTPSELAEAVRRRYGKDRTFAVPILTMCALAGLVDWREVPRLPFELACLPQSWYRFARLPVVSYALPALIAIGQCIHFHRGGWNPLTRVLRWLGRDRSLRVLERIQPASGGFLEATPLTSFVVMSLASLPHAVAGPARRVMSSGLDFIIGSIRDDGSWPIDTNLSIWVTTLSINALDAAGDLELIENRPAVRDWIFSQQLKVRHPYTGAAPGAWGWSHLSGSVPDCDDTPGALLALACRGMAEPLDRSALVDGLRWMLDLQNGDGGFPTFCRGWGWLPFDRSGSDLTAHALRALHAWDGIDMDGRLRRRVTKARGHALRYLAKQQRPDGSWLPLWFGNQHAPDDINPTYGTSRVLAAYRALGLADAPAALRGVQYLLSTQNADGGWGGAAGTPSSVEETSLAVDAILGRRDSTAAAEFGLEYLVHRVEAGTIAEPSPIGFYFAKLWYFEKLYPLIFATAALGRALREHRDFN